jgi:hypothetical protein
MDTAANITTTHKSALKKAVQNSIQEDQPHRVGQQTLNKDTNNPAGHNTLSSSPRLQE